MVENSGRSTTGSFSTRRKLVIDLFQTKIKNLANLVRRNVSLRSWVTNIRKLPLQAVQLGDRFSKIFQPTSQYYIDPEFRVNQLLGSLSLRALHAGALLCVLKTSAARSPTSPSVLASKQRRCRAAMIPVCTNGTSISVIGLYRAGSSERIYCSGI